MPEQPQKQPKKPFQPKVRTKTHKDTYSPFIVYLSDEQKKEHIEETPSNLGTDFLQASPLAEKIEEQDMLLLTRSDIAGQLIEDSQLKNTSERITTDHFAPKSLPKGYAKQFDLPEKEKAKKEELPKEDLVDLDTLFETEEKRGFSFPTLKPVAHFLLLAAALILPLYAFDIFADINSIKTEAQASSLKAIESVNEGTKATISRNIGDASASFEHAYSSFAQAEQTISQYGDLATAILASTPGLSEYKSGQALLRAGQSLSIAASRVTEGMQALESSLDPTLTNRIDLLSTYIESAIPHLDEAQNELERVDANDVPEEYQARYQQFAQILPAINSSLNDFTEFSYLLQTLLGKESTQRYLVVFQNNTEIRPTGGFMGSFAEISLRDGEIVDMNIPGGGTYDLQGQLTIFAQAPYALQLLSPRWEFQDTNWFADFPTSAKQILDYYQAAGGASMDGVIAVNATYIADFLELLGPVDMPDYERTISSENFLEETQKIVELEYDKEENKPKAFIGDMAPILLDRVYDSSPEELLPVLDEVQAGFSNGDIQVFFTSNQAQTKAIELGWAGEMKYTEGDYVMIVDTNLGGGKTDNVIGQDAELHINIENDGTITNTLSVTRIHYGNKNDLFSGVNNVDYVRVYVPKGAKLIEATGFTIPDETLFEEGKEEWEIDEDILFGEEEYTLDISSKTRIYDELGKTVFGNWVQTKPNSKTTYSFTYELPFKLDLEENDSLYGKAKAFLGIPKTDQYSLLIQKQSGILDRSMDIFTHLPEGLEPKWSSHPLETSIDATVNTFISTLFEVQ